MHATLDLVSDPVTDAAKALNVSNVEQVFLKAAEGAGFTNPQEVATHRYNKWKHEGYTTVPPYVKEFCVRVSNKLSATDFLKRVVCSGAD